MPADRTLPPSGKSGADASRARIDVVIPCYNYGRFLAQSVGSVLDQSMPAVRVVIIDDASADETPDVARALVAADGRVSYIRHGRNLGHIATFNQGIDLARSDYFLLLSADDFLLPGALARAIAVMDAREDLVLAVGRWQELDDTSPRLMGASPGAAPEVLSGRAFIERSGPRNIVATATAITRTVVQKRVGGYRPELTHACDMEMWLRLACQGSVAFIHADQAVYRRHQSNMSQGYDMLTDLQQRAAAFRLFLPAYRQRYADGDVLERRLFRLLAHDALAHAHLAFNLRRQDESERIQAFAEDLHPGILRSPAALRLAAKRWLGPALWSCLAPMLGSSGPRARYC